jgi:hypothetical protein
LIILSLLACRILGRTTRAAHLTNHHVIARFQSREGPGGQWLEAGRVAFEINEDLTLVTARPVYWRSKSACRSSLGQRTSKTLTGRGIIMTRTTGVMVAPTIWPPLRRDRCQNSNTEKLLAAFVVDLPHVGKIVFVTGALQITRKLGWSKLQRRLLLPLPWAERNGRACPCPRAGAARVPNATRRFIVMAVRNEQNLAT